MKVSVIVPAYNRERFIGTALRSLLRQRDAAELDIIVIDDGSTDRTAEVVNEFIRLDPCIRLIRQDNKGISGARNTGLKNIAADAELVTFLDSDDISCEGYFAAVVPLFRDDPGLELTYARFTMASRIDDRTLAPAGGARTNTYRGVHLASAFFRKAAIEEVGGLNENFVQAEDVDFLLRCFGRPRKYLLVDHAAIIYRRHPGNTTSNEREVRHHFLRAILAHAQRRRHDPTLLSIPEFFDFTTPMMYEAEAVDPNCSSLDSTQ